MDKYDWDLFVLIFGETDRLQHFFWHYIDPTHPKYNPEEAQKFLPSIIKFYQELDGIVGEFIKYMDDDTSLFIVSDHGFCPLERYISLHNILEQNQLFSYKSAQTHPQPFFISIQDDIRGFLHRNSAIYRALKEVTKVISYRMKGRDVKKEIFLKNFEKHLGGDNDGYWRMIDW